MTGHSGRVVVLALVLPLAGYATADDAETPAAVERVRGARARGVSLADADGSNVGTFGFGGSGPWHPGTLENGAGE